MEAILKDSTAPGPDLDMWRPQGSLCGGPPYRKEILFKVREIVL